MTINRDLLAANRVDVYTTSEDETVEETDHEIITGTVLRWASEFNNLGSQWESFNLLKCPQSGRV